jgi:hypothetical protein
VHGVTRLTTALDLTTEWISNTRVKTCATSAPKQLEALDQCPKSRTT